MGKHFPSTATGQNIFLHYPVNLSFNSGAFPLMWSNVSANMFAQIQHVEFAQTFLFTHANVPENCAFKRVCGHKVRPCDKGLNNTINK